MRVEAALPGEQHEQRLERRAQRFPHRLEVDAVQDVLEEAADDLRQLNERSVP